jgi:hypothetical protein
MAAPEGKATSPDESEMILAQQDAKSMTLACGKHRKTKIGGVKIGSSVDGSD